MHQLSSGRRSGDSAPVLLQQFPKPVYRGLIGFEKTADEFFQPLARHESALKVSFLALGEEFRIFQCRLERLPHNLDAVHLRHRWEPTKVRHGAEPA